MRRFTAARADRFSATMARLLLVCAVLLAATGQAAYILRIALPGWSCAAVLLDTIAVAVYAFIRSLTPRVDHRIYGG
jgi:hypothetical protein